MFRKAVVANVPLLRQMQQALKSKTDRTLPAEFFQDLLDRTFQRRRSAAPAGDGHPMGPIRELFDYDAASGTDAYRDLIFPCPPQPSSSSPDSVAANRGAARARAGRMRSDRHRRFHFGFRGDLRVYSIRRSWLGPVRAESEISQDPAACRCTRFSLVRILVAYVLSLVLRWRTAIRREIASSGNHTDSVWDFWQSIPVLSSCRA